MRSTSHRRNRVLVTGSTLLLLATLVVRGEEKPVAAGATPPAAVEGEKELETAIPPTEITADTLDYDMKNKLAHLEGNVHVVDQDIDLRANRMVIHFVYSEAEGRDVVQRIVATGKVVITRDKVVATGSEANYDVDKGLVVLTGEPILIQGNSKITGARDVIFNRAQERVYTDGGKPKIEFYRSDNEQGSMVDALKAGDGKAAVGSDAYTH